MFLPLKDENPTRSFAIVTYVLIALNIVGYVIETQLMRQSGPTAIIAGYGLVANRLFADPAGEAFTLLTSMFMHGDLAHLGGNLLFLYIFGDNVEDALGHLRYIAFYLIGGVAAAAAQVATGSAGGEIAMVGASGAISGVLGGYIVLYPRAPILMLNPVPLLWLFLGLFVSFPAWLVIGYWFAGNLASGVFSLGGRGGGGVAFFAHIGGFLAGLLLIKPLLTGRGKRESYQWTGWAPPPPRGGSSRARYEAWRNR